MAPRELPDVPPLPDSEMDVDEETKTDEKKDEKKEMPAPKDDEAKEPERKKPKRQHPPGGWKHHRGWQKQGQQERSRCRRRIITEHDRHSGGPCNAQPDVLTSGWRRQQSRKRRLPRRVGWDTTEVDDIRLL